MCCLLFIGMTGKAAPAGAGESGNVSVTFKTSLIDA